MDQVTPSDGQLRAMALLATLRTAAEVCEAISLREAGRDPADQEARLPALIALRDTEDQLAPVVRRLRLRSLLPQLAEAELVQQFEDRMLLARAARLMHLAHQRLLSLYPEVDGELAERARRVQAEAARLATSEDADFEHSLASWCSSAEALSRGLQPFLYTAN